MSPQTKRINYSDNMKICYRRKYGAFGIEQKKVKRVGVLIREIERKKNPVFQLLRVFYCENECFAEQRHIQMPFLTWNLFFYWFRFWLCNQKNTFVERN